MTKIMTKDTITKDNAIFGRRLSRLSPDTVSKFGSNLQIIEFLQALCQHGNIALAARNIEGISLLAIHDAIKSDRWLARCVKIAKDYAVDTAEGVLYDRAINGYQELVYNKEGECIARKKKYCLKSLLAYLKANFAKYRIDQGEKKVAASSKNNESGSSNNGANEAVKFEVEPYNE